MAQQHLGTKGEGNNNNSASHNVDGAAAAPSPTIAPSPAGIGRGTLAYMSPELLTGPHTKASDVWAFGVVLWQMCTGDQPHRDKAVPQLLMGLKLGRLRLTWPDTVPSALCKLGSACMDPEPARRPGFEALATALDKAGEIWLQ